MRVDLRKISTPKLPTNRQLKAFAKGLFPPYEGSPERLAVLLCASLTLAIAPDDERNVQSMLFYLSELSREDGVCDMTILALEMWLTGTIPSRSENEALEKILSCFRGAYLFNWQKRLIMLAIDTRNEIVCHDGFRVYTRQTYVELSQRFSPDTALSDIL